MRFPWTSVTYPTSNRNLVDEVIRWAKGTDLSPTISTNDALIYFQSSTETKPSCSICYLAVLYGESSRLV